MFSTEIGGMEVRVVPSRWVSVEEAKWLGNSHVLPLYLQRDGNLLSMKCWQLSVGFQEDGCLKGMREE